MALQDRSNSTAKKSPSTLLPSEGEEVPYYMRKDALLKQGPTSLLPDDTHRKKAQDEVVAVSPSSLLPEALVESHAQPREELAAISPSELLPPVPPRQLPDWVNWKVLGAAGVVLLALVLAYQLASHVNQKTAPELMQEAVRYLNQDNRTAAVIQLKNVLQLDPSHIEARLLHGKLILEAGDARVAEEEFRRAQEQGAKKDEVLPLLARALIARKEYQEALDATALGPGEDSTKQSAELIALRGQALLFLGRKAQAREAFESALKTDPEQPDALLGLARVAVLDRDQDWAMKNISRAAAKASNNPDVLALLADLTRLAGDEAKAAEHYEKAVSVAPNNHLMRLSLVSIYIGSKEYDKAIKHLDYVIKAEPENATANFLYAAIELRREKFAEARKRAAKSLNAQGNHIPSLLIVGASAFATGDYPIAEKALRRTLVLAPKYPVARKLLGASLVRMNRPREAIDELQPLLQRLPKDPELHLTLGEAYLALRDYPNATKSLEQAAALAPEDARARIRLGRTRMEANDLEQAVADLQAALSLAPDASGAKITLAMTYIRRREFDRAIATVNEMQPDKRKNPMLFNLLGGAYLGKKDFKAATTAFERALKIAPDFMPAVMNLVQLDIREKDPFSAARRLRDVLKVSPNNMQAMFALAAVLSGSPQTVDEAENWLEQAYRAHPDSAEPSIRLARFHLARGSVKLALQAAGRGLERKVVSMNDLDEFGRIQLQARAHRQALDTYVRMASENPKSALAHYRLALVQSETGNSAAARVSLSEAMKLDPDAVEPKGMLAQLEARAGNVATGLQLAEEIQRKYPKWSLGPTLKGDILATSKRFSEAAVAYESAYGLEKDPRLVIKLHRAYFHAGKIERGEAIVDDWLRTNVDDRATRQVIADFSMSLKRFQFARSHYEWLAREMPKNQYIIHNLAVAYDKLNDPRALEFADRAYRLDGRNPYAADTLGWMLVRLGRPESGRDILKEAVERAPDVPDIRYHYASALAKSGQRKEARVHLERAFSLKGKLADEAAAKALLQELKG